MKKVLIRLCSLAVENALLLMIIGFFGIAIPTGIEIVSKWESGVSSPEFSVLAAIYIFLVCAVTIPIIILAILPLLRKAI